jgi:hypothetical protein
MVRTASTDASFSFGGYAFTADEMHSVMADRYAEAIRFANLGPAALDAMDMDDLLNFDMGRTLAIVDFYNTIFLPQQSTASTTSTASTA